MYFTQIKLFLFFLVFASFSCNKENVPLLTDCDSNTICIKLDKTTISADGISTVKVIATIPKEASSGRNIVTFKSTTGIFINVDSPTNPRDTAIQGQAFVFLRIGTTPGVQKITASVFDGSKNHYAEALLVLEPPGKILELTIDSPSSKADGFSEITLSAKVPSTYYNGNRKITFLSGDAGVFDNPTNQDGSRNKTIVTIGEDGTAKARLIVSTIPNKYTIKAFLEEPNLNFQDEKILELTGFKSSEVISFENLFIDELLADASKLVDVKIVVKGINPFNKMLRLEVSGGWSIINQNQNQATFMLTQSGEAHALLRVGQEVTNCFLTASLDNYQIIVPTTLKRAFPTKIKLIPNKSSIKFKDDSVDLTAFLSRLTGKVSTDSPILFEAIQTQSGVDVNVGFFNLPFGKSNTNEQVAITYHTPSDSSIIAGKPILIKAYSLNDQTVIDSISLIVN